MAFRAGFFRIPRTKDLGIYGAEWKKINRMRKTQRSSLQVLGFESTSTLPQRISKSLFSTIKQPLANW